MTCRRAEAEGPKRSEKGRRAKDEWPAMIEALAAALLLGGINTLADFASAELELEARPIYVSASSLQPPAVKLGVGS